MLLDLIDTNNYAMYNIKLAQIVGLEAAVYCNQLLTIQSKAQRKNKIEDNFFRVDRSFITKQTSLSIGRQVELDEELSKLDIISQSSYDINLLWVNIDILSKIITNDDVDLSLELSQIIKSSKDRKKLLKQQAKEAKQSAINHNLVTKLECKNPELQEAMKDWVNAINSEGANMKPLNFAAIKTFYDEVNKSVEFKDSEGNICHDLDMAIGIINVATAHYWKTAKYAVNKYFSEYNAVQYKDGTNEVKLDIEY